MIEKKPLVKEKEAFMVPEIMIKDSQEPKNIEKSNKQAQSKK